MKILVRETGETEELKVVDLTERDITGEFFPRYFCDVEGIYETPDEEKEMFGTEAEWTVESSMWFDELADVLASYNECIDGIRMQFLDYDISPDKYCFKGRNYAMEVL